jgi:hypothetical protein
MDLLSCLAYDSWLRKDPTNLGMGYTLSKYSTDKKMRLAQCLVRAVQPDRPKQPAIMNAPA